MKFSLFGSLLIVVRYFRLVKSLLNNVVGEFEAEAGTKLSMNSLKLWAWNILLIPAGQLPIYFCNIVGNLPDFVNFYLTGISTVLWVIPKWSNKSNFK